MNKVLMIPRLSDSVIEMARRFQPADCALDVIAAGASEEELAAVVARTEFVMGMISRPLPKSVLPAFARVKLVQLLSAGYDEVDIPAMRAMRVPVSNNGGANAVAVAEHTIMLMLAVYRNLITMDTKVRTGNWPTGPVGSLRYYELEGKKVGLIGLGMIGREVAKRLRGFEAEVYYFDMFRQPTEVETALGVRYLPFAELLATVDVLSLHVPLTPETRGIVGKAQLASMKRSAIFINTARGGLVDQDALIAALRDGTIAAAGLDTVEPEPPPADLPLLNMPNVTITPHVAGPTVESWPKRLRNGYANIQRVANGERPLWVIPELRDLF
ncbi:MAG: 2-hydroxyacid dehydrogenase [Chloroflexota bacterium]